MAAADFFNRVNGNLSFRNNGAALNPPGQIGISNNVVSRVPAQTPSTGLLKTPGIQQPIQPVQPQARPQTPTGPVSQAEGFINQGLLNLSDIAAGKNSVLDIAEEKFLGRAARTGAAQGAANQQRFAQQNLDPASINALELARQRGSSIDTGQFQSEIAGQRAGQALQAQQQLSQQALQASQFQRQVAQDKFNSLIRLGGEQNLINAEEIAQDLYGTGVDMRGLKAQGLDQLVANYASIPGMTAQDALEVMKRDGALEFWGISEQEAMGRLQTTFARSNPIAQAEAEFTSMLEAGDITQEDFDRMMILTREQILNPGDFTLQDSYVVTDANGREIGNFLTENEADIFMRNNPGGTKTFTKNGFLSQGTEVRAEGEVFVDGNNVFTIIEGQKVLAKPDLSPDAAFSTKNQNLINFYESNPSEQNNRKLDNIVDAQTNALKSRADLWPSNVGKDSLAYRNLLKTSPKLPPALQNLTSIEEGTGASSTIKIMALEKPINSVFQFGDRLLVLQDVQAPRVKGDNPTTYTLFDPIANETITILTGKDKTGKKHGKISVSFSNASPITDEPIGPKGIEG
jgi:hypothetical protein